ncbi:Uncharacterised protein [Mycobacteroides abscessus subsp. abscessus]|nr:Uncharacterised protein [Mycobacteroides abscessus subsp. abscessus]
MRRLEEIEARIEQLESSIEDYEQQLCEPEIYQDHEKVLAITKDNSEAKEELELLMEEWAELAE